MDELRIWTCRNGHALGQIRKSGRGLHQLFLYRQAVNLDQTSPCDVDIIAVVEGTVMDICCDICGEVRTWIAGQEQMDRLITQYALNHGLDVSEIRLRIEQVVSNQN